MPFWRSERRIAREADAWIANVHGPDWDAQAAALRAWRAADPRHEAAFQRSERLWRDTGGARRIHPAGARPSSFANRASARLGPRLAFAAMVGTVVVAGGVTFFERPSADRLGPHAEMATDASPRVIQLPDGSTVMLGEDSLIATNFDGATRAISLLRGKARFSVAHDANHPFVVAAAGRTVTARGTIFDVVLQPAGLSVTMIEGIVEVAHQPVGGATPAGIIRLARGERLVVLGNKEQVSAPKQTSARGGLRDYASTPVAQIVADANIGATRPIRFGSEALGRKMVQGRFDLSDTLGVAQQLAAALDTNLLDDGQSLILSPKPTP